MTSPIVFKATITQHGSMNAGYVEFPFSTEEVFGKKGQVKIKALFDGTAEYRGSLTKMGGKKHLLILTQEVRKKINKSFDEEVEVKLWEDKEERIVEIPEDVMPLFEQNPKAKELFDAMSYTHRKEYMRWITDAKKDDTRERRKIKMIEMILNGKKGI